MHNHVEGAVVHKMVNGNDSLIILISVMEHLFGITSVCHRGRSKPNINTPKRHQKKLWEIWVNGPSNKLTDTNTVFIGQNE